jgi:UDP-GlcNAc:undecaprenyl-phosphate GlcNAc-1-phosphate transferase
LDFLSILIYSITAFAVSILFFPVLIKLLSQWKVFDSPGRHKIHEKFKPSMGGVPIIIGVAFSMVIALPYSELAKLKFFLISLALMFITGLRDDILTLTPRQKMISQILPIFILVFFGGTILTSLYDFNPAKFPEFLSLIITLFTIIILTNAYNLIDGVDGLAGTIGLIVFIFFGTWFYFAEDYSLALLSLAFAGAILGFLFFNWQPSKIFMGDTGALSIGFVISFLSIQFINHNFSLSQQSQVSFEASISTAVCVLIIPVFDTLRVIVLRLRRLESPFKADKNHLHHQFLNLGFSHAMTVLFLGGINLTFILLAWVLRSHPDIVILPIIIGVCLIINQTLKFALKRNIENGRQSSVTQKSN